MLKLSRLFSYLFGAAALALAVFAFQELQFIGFPDGHIGEWDWARKTVFYLIIITSTLTGLWLFCLGWFSTQKRPAKTLGVTCVSYVIFTALLFAIDSYLSHLSGRGG